jgi:hypothetical protein
MLRYLALLLLAPLLLILAWGYVRYPKSLPRTAARRVFDWVALLLATGVVVASAVLGFDAATLPPVDAAAGRTSGAIWQQVFPVLLGYGACVGVLLVALVVRHLLWHRRSSP